MNSQKNPGSNSWEVVRKLGKGGQGETSLVKSISPPEREGVLKALKNNKSEQARARMRREVSNLDTLSFQGVKVPAVIESNTDRFKESGVPLYFIMQFVDGCTLDEIVVQQRPLSLERAAAMVLDLGTTMSAAHRQCVFHRDLKPANIIVRNADAADLVIVDYGLSFNVEDDEETVTETSDRFRNEFLALGETNTPGGNKRDARIDVTALCAVLYFCLTGQVPGQLADGRGRCRTGVMECIPFGITFLITIGAIKLRCFSTEDSHRTSNGVSKRAQNCQTDFEKSWIHQETNHRIPRTLPLSWDSN